jgi:rfaE bifunctional protein kinase chain/domain
MTAERFTAITHQYPELRIAIIGDFCLDRYLEIDPARQETSIETGLPVYNVENVRAQPGGAGTILNNLSALGIGQIIPIGFVGEDGEGYELCRALGMNKTVDMKHFVQTPARKTFAYCKPLLLEPGAPPRELNRFDQKNWTTTPSQVSEKICHSMRSVGASVSALILLDQAHRPETGVVTRNVINTVQEISSERPDLPIIADSRTGLSRFPPVIFKMNADELTALAGTDIGNGISEITAAALKIARQNARPVFVTLAERGILAACPDGQNDYVPALPVCGPIDIVGAGDAVTANLASALAAKASVHEALELANAAASVVIHQLGTTGTASLKQLAERSSDATRAVRQK